MSIRIRHILVALLGACIFMQCASIAQPEGGPRDSLPPLLISTVPAQRVTNFRGKRITLNFNEYIVLRDQQKEFIVSPPAANGMKPLLTPKGRSIQIDFENPPDSNTTYRLDFGNSIADNNEGNRLGNYAYIFSTGPVLDTLLVSGLVRDAQKRDSVLGAHLFFFDARVDSVAAYDSTLFNARPEAIFRSDSSGFFLADILRDKDYRIYAMLDKNGNQRYEAGADYVAMLDSSYNPTRMPDFDMWIEAGTARHGPRRVIDPPQVRLNLFLEEPIRRQTILSNSRPERQKLEIIFNSKERAQITSFAPEGVDSTWFRKESGIKGDTVWYWLAPPTRQQAETLRDTIRAKITYMSQDSIWRPKLRTETLAFVHRIIDPNARGRQAANSAYADSIKQVKIAKQKAKRDKRLQKKWIKMARRISRERGDPKRTDAELIADSSLFKQVKIDSTTRAVRQNKEPEIKNPFGFKVNAANPLNPEAHISLAFDYPLRWIDRERIKLIRLTESQAAGPRRNRQSAEAAPTQKVEVPEPFTIDFDTLSRKRVTIRANWKANEEYNLLIPDSVFLNIAYQKNDTLQSTFKVADSSKFGIVILDLRADSTLNPDCEYILELQNREGATIRKVRHAMPGESYRLRYLPPSIYRLRVTEDRNRNGEWDTGSLTDRRQPERIRIWESTGTGRDIIAKENWEVGVPVYLKALFEQP